jgi:calcium/calmodulin-dependent protein kinase I
LKPENLLLASRDLDTEVKIADFGLSKIINTKVMMQTACGELPKNLNISLSNVSLRHSWLCCSGSALGYRLRQGGGHVEHRGHHVRALIPKIDLILNISCRYILLCGFPPFYGETVPELFEQIMSADYDYPEDYW